MMKTKAKNNSLTKKVLFSIVAAGMLSSFVMSAEAADHIIIFDGQHAQENIDVPWVWVERAQGNDSAKLTLNGGNVAGSEFNEYADDDSGDHSENHLSSYLIRTAYPKDSVDLEQAQVAVFVNKSCTTLIADNVHFTGEVAVRGYKGDPNANPNDYRDGVAKITINGGSITAGKYYYHISNSTEKRIEEDATNILAYENGQIELKDVVISSNISAYSGGQVTVNNSSADATGEIYVPKKIYAADAGSEININFAATETNPKGTITVGSQIFAGKGATISIDNANINVTKQDGLQHIGTIESTGENSLVELKNSTITADNLKATDSGKLTLDNNSRATVKDIRVEHRFSDDSGGGTIVIEGSFKTDSLSAYANGEIYLQGGADAVYEVARDFHISDGGKLYIKSGKLEALTPDTFKTSGTQYDKIFLEGTGVLSTISKNIYTNEASAIQNNPGELDKNGIVFQGGELILNDAEYTEDYLEYAKALLGNNTKLTMANNPVDDNGQIKNTMSTDQINKGANKDINFNQLKVIGKGNLLVGSDGGNKGKVIDGIEVIDTVENGFGAGFLDLGAEGAKSVIIVKKQELTLGGSLGGNLITVNGKDVDDIKVVVGITEDIEVAANGLYGNYGYTGYNGTLNIGNALATAGTQYKISGEVVVNKDSNLNVKGQTEITTGLTLNEGTVDVNIGSLKTKDLKITGNSKLLGMVNAETLDITAGKTLFIGDANKAGWLTVDKAILHGGLLFLDPAWKDGAAISDASGLAVKSIAAADGAYVVGRNSVLALGAALPAAEEKFGKTGQVWGKDSISAVAYIAAPVDVAGGSLTVNGALVDAASVATTTPGSISFAANSLLIVDADKAAAGPLITGVSTANIDANAKLYIDEAKNGEAYKILAGNINAAWAENSIISNNSLFKFTKTDDANAYTITASIKTMDEAFGAGEVSASNAYDAAMKAQSEGDAAYDFIMAATDNRVNASAAAQVNALNSAAAMGELAGVEHSTYAVSSLLADAVSEHLSLASDKQHDSDIWAKYIHTKEDVDGLAVTNFGAAYDAKYNGIVVGADLYKKGKAAIGAALTYADGNINGHSLAARTKNEATYYGASIYGGIQSGDSAVIGDISYLHGKHDITQYNSGKTLTADAKADAFSMGVRAEKSLKAGVGKFVPYAGLRYMHLSTGNYTNSIGMSYDGDAANLWLLPVGVKYSAEVKAGSWTLRPVAELGYVWSMGDREATQTVSLNGASDGFGYDVTDSGSYIGHFGLEAEKANVTYGLGYEYQKGDSVKANRWTAKLNWSF